MQGLGVYLINLQDIDFLCFRQSALQWLVSAFTDERNAGMLVAHQSILPQLQVVVLCKLVFLPAVMPRCKNR